MYIWGGGGVEVYVHITVRSNIKQLSNKASKVSDLRLEHFTKFHFSSFVLDILGEEFRLFIENIRCWDKNKIEHNQRIKRRNYFKNRYINKICTLSFIRSLGLEGY